MKEQITSSIIMVRPKNFGFNAETAVNNSFQKVDENLNANQIAEKAIVEFDTMVDKLRSKGIEVIVWEDSDKPPKPDAVFPNNWFTTHVDNSIVTFPMYSEVRRKERREDLIDSLSSKATKRYSFEYYEEDEKYLEGTGSMILDRTNRIIYACLSDRTSIEVLEKFSILKEFRKIYFTAEDQNGDPIYHTNIMMAVGEKFAAICFDCITDEDERKEVRSSLLKTEKEIVELTYDQIQSFAGNMIQVKNKNEERFIIMSQQALSSLRTKQMNKLEQHGEILPVEIPTIERSGGGSARCMIAENFLQS